MSAFHARTFQPLENYGIIGNLHTAALVGMDGSIDWCCLPHFDSPSVFGALLDNQRGGYFKISPSGEMRHKQFYLVDSNVLVTRFLSSEGAGEIVDFMPVNTGSAEGVQDHQMYRIVRVVRGTLRFHLRCQPAFNYGLSAHKVHRQREGALFQGGDLALKLYSPIPLTLEGGAASGTFVLKTNQSHTFVLRQSELAPMGQEPSDLMVGDEALQKTLDYWRRWISQMKYQRRWREMVARSALVLKVLTFAPTGAIVAAPTTSLPEYFGGRRNWDYRYTWIRDASFTLYGLLRLGFHDEAQAFMGWLENRLHECGTEGTLQVAYGIHGEQTLQEKRLPHLQGYRDSKPVRIGNAAHRQRQLDIYGELMDSVYLYNKYGSPISYDLWIHLRRILNYVCRHWREKDNGIWEIRNTRQHFVYSKVMCWVALDRGLRLASKRSLPGEWDLWAKNRDAIYAEVQKRGWDPKQKTFVQHYGTDAVDASALLLPLVKFMSPTDPRMISTLARIREKLVSDSLVRRYEIGRGLGDGLSGQEGTFSMCTFWYAEALARAGQLDEARWTFEKMLGYANSLGLFSEEVGLSGEQLGNYPQAFTHLALISAAYNIDQALESAEGKRNLNAYPVSKI